MLQWLQALEEVPPSEDVLEGIVKRLKEDNIIRPSDLVGASEEDVAQLWQTAGIRAFLRRAVRAADLTFGAAPAPQRAAGDSVEAVRGDSTSAARVAEAFGNSSLAPAAVKVAANMPQLMQAVGCEGADWTLIADESLWSGLLNETLVAESERPPRAAFTYIDFTSRLMLPIWMPAQTVGRSPDSDEEAGGRDTPVHSLQGLGTAIKRAMGSPRAFRTMSQWTAVWVRYSMLAVSTRQMSWGSTHAHLATICRLAEDSRLRGGTPLVAVIYDMMVRQAWAKRSKQRDPTLNITLECARVDENLLDAARHRLDGGRRTGSAASSSDGLVDTESAAARAASAAGALQRKVESAGRALQAQQDSLAKREQAMGAGGWQGQKQPTGGKGGKGGKGGARPRSRSPKAGSRWDRRNKWYDQNVRDKKGW